MPIFIVGRFPSVEQISKRGEASRLEEVLKMKNQDHEFLMNDSWLMSGHSLENSCSTLSFPSNLKIFFMSSIETTTKILSDVHFASWLTDLTHYCGDGKARNCLQLHGRRVIKSGFLWGEMAKMSFFLEMQLWNGLQQQCQSTSKMAFEFSVCHSKHKRFTSIRNLVQTRKLKWNLFSVATASSSKLMQMEKGDIEKGGMIVKCPSLRKKILHFLLGIMVQLTVKILTTFRSIRP